MSSLITNFVAKRRRLHEARAVCQLRFGRRARCAICGAKISGGSWGRPNEALCHPLGCPDHPCHAFCMLAVLGSDQPVGTSQTCPSLAGCDRRFSQLCFHRAWLGRCSGQRSLGDLGSSAEAEPTAAPQDADGGGGGGGVRRLRRLLPSWTSARHRHRQQSQLRRGTTVAGDPGNARRPPLDASVSDGVDSEDPLELSLDSLESECAICCSRIAGDAGVPDRCCHSFCLDCLRRWCATSATCPLDRKPVTFVYRRPAGGGGGGGNSSKFSGRYRLRGDGTCGALEESAAGGVSRHFSELPAVPPTPVLQTQTQTAAPVAREVGNGGGGGGGLCNGLEASLLFLAVLIGVTTALFVRRFGPPLLETASSSASASAGTPVGRLVALMKSYNASALVCLAQTVILLALLFRPVHRLLCWLCDLGAARPR